MESLKPALIKALIVLIPSYSVAFLTEKMVFVIPMLAASGIVAAGITFTESRSVNRRVDEDEDGDVSRVDSSEASSGLDATDVGSSAS